MTDTQDNGEQQLLLEQADGPATTGSVENTALWVACKRALVTTGALPLVHDPVTPAMLPPGYAPMRAWAVQAAAAEEAAPSQPDRQALLTLALRCRFIDDQLLATLHAMRKALTPADARVAAAVAASRPPIQVVLLGAGLDTRPWRLPLGADVAWYELDLPAMSAFKRASLARAGAHTAPPAPTPASAHGGTSDGRGRGGFPLHVGRYAAVAADVAATCWLVQLAEAGWERAAPTLWCLEGVFYYLPAAAAVELLQTITAASQAAGMGAFVASLCSPAMVLAINSIKGPGRPQAGPPCTAAGGVHATGATAQPAAALKPGEEGIAGEDDGEGEGEGKTSWWFQASFPDYEATLGDDPCAALRRLGWHGAELVSIEQSAAMYGVRRSTRIVPSAAQAAAETACSGAAQYQLVSATLGLS